MDGENLADFYNRTHEATNTLRAQAAEIHEITQRLEDLTQDGPAWYAATRARVEAKVALEQAEELRRALEELREKL